MIQKCFRKMSVCFLVGLSIVMLTACGGNGNSQSSNKSSKDKGYEESAEKMELKIEDIDWQVEESILDGEKFLSLNYTNNSDYTIMDVEIKFKQKEGITKEQLSVFDEYKETYDYSDEEVAEIYILGYNRKCTRPGETAKDSPLVLNGTYYMAESMAQYELMEPETITVAFIGSNDKGYIMYYDYNSQVYGSSTHDAANIHEWSDKELAKLIDAPDCVAISVDIDDDDIFRFTGYGVKKEMYKSYVEEIKSKGFTEDADEYDDWYEAKNSDGISFDIRFSAIEESIDVNVSKD
ncbi:MAG: hypothetical protein K6G76_09885 [Lachnospiraceae bacterium]|nr:hypothetical protein [Lachnospiraceae bacterium]